MNDDGLFREEAVREYLRGREERALLRVSPRWLDWAFHVVAVAAIAAVGFAALVRLPTEVEAPARLVGDARGLRVVAVLDEAVAARVSTGQPLRFVCAELPRARVLRVDRVRRGDAERLVRVESDLPADTVLPPGLAGRAVVETGSQSLFARAAEAFAR